MAVARWLETDSLSNQNISSAAVIGAYTADADRMIVCDVSLDQVAGGGDYVVYVTRQIAGAGSAYVMLPKTTCTAAAGETAIAMQSGPVTVRSGDVLTVYIDGLAGDTTTPDTTVRWFEMATLRPATADRQLTVAATGEASANVTYRAGVAVAPADGNGYDLVHVASWLGTTPAFLNLAGQVQAVIDDTFSGPAIRDAIGMASANMDTQLAALPTDQDVRDAMKLAPTAGDPAAGSVDKHLDDILEDTSATLPAALAVVDANVDAIKLITDDLDVSAVTQLAASSAGNLRITAGLTFSEGVTGMTIPADWATAIWTLKNNEHQADTAARIQLRVSNPADGEDGLQRLNGAAPETPITAADGTLTVTQASGRIDIYLTDELTALLDKASGLGWDVKFIDTNGDSTGQRGTADVVLTETRALA